MRFKELITILSLLVLAINGHAVAQEPAELMAIASAADEALNAHDMDLWLSYCTDDCVFDFVPMSTPLTGKEAIGAFFENVFNGFPDFGTTDGVVLAAGNTVVAEHSTTGTHQGLWNGIPPTGNVALMPHIDIIEFEEDRIAKFTTYSDMAGMMIQLGVMPMPEMPALVPSFTPPDPEPTGLSPLDAAADFVTRWNSHDLVELAKIIHQDMVFFGAGLPTSVDRNGYFGLNEAVIYPSSSDVIYQATRQIDMGGGWVIVEGSFIGTQDGPYMGVPATGRPFAVRGVMLLKFDQQGLMTNFSLYYDNVTLLTILTAQSFTDFGSGTTTELFVGGATWQLNWGQGPWTWAEITGEPLLDSNVTAVLDLHTTGAADISDDLVATLPIGGTLTLTAHDEHFPDVVTGTMVLSGAGTNVIDISAERVIVDEGSGMFLAPFHPPGPHVILALEEATGVFGHITQIGPWELSLAGSYVIPLIEGQDLQSNISTALNGNVALIGGIGEFSLSGLYDLDSTKMPISFCEYGTGSTTQLGSAGGGWDQQWGLGPWDWIECTAEANVQFLNENVTGILTTEVIAEASINEDMILHIPLDGQMILTEHAANNSQEEVGKINCDVLAIFVADLNAERAVVDDATGTITVAFGASVEEGPDGLMTVTETSGSLVDIKQVRPWEWHVNGTMTIARVPDLPLQDNILAALQNSDLLLGADEEFVLTGWYYRDTTGQ